MRHAVREHARSHAPLSAPLFDCCWCTCFTTVVLVCQVCRQPVVLLYSGCEHVEGHREFLRQVMSREWPWT
jgi:hypothetical protein